MIKVAALTKNHKDPATRFRVGQHLDALKAHGVEVDEYPSLIPPQRPKFVAAKSETRKQPLLDFAKLAALTPARIPGLIASRRYPVTWLLRELVSEAYTLERFLKPPVVLDVDDALWTRSDAAAQANRKIAKRAAVVMAGNAYLADWYGQYASDVRIIPTAVDTARFTPAPRKDGPFTVGWIGSYTNLPYLEAIEPALHRFLTAYPDARLQVVCDRMADFRLLDDSQAEFVPWSAETEVASIQAMNVGLMPLEDTPWTRGKCSFKMLQYMSCAVPSVVAPVGMNAEVLALGSVGHAAATHDDWFAALEHYHQNESTARADGATGRQIVESHFSKSLVAEKIAGIFHEFS